MSENNRPKEKIVGVRLLPEEAEVLQAKAEEANMSKARFLKRGCVRKNKFYGRRCRKVAI